jgi:hypothetical protein
MLLKSGNPIRVLYVMIPFLGPTLGTIGPQKRHLEYLGWLEVELTSEKDDLLGTKKAQGVAFQLQTFQKSHCFANIAHC